MTNTTQLPRLTHLLRCVGFSLSEAQDAIAAHRFGDGYGCEAVNHAGGSHRLIGLAFEQRRHWTRFPRYTRANAAEYGSVIRRSIAIGRA